MSSDHFQRLEQEPITSVKMIPKHFGLKYSEESYMLKELEKIRKETKTEFLQFKQRLAYKPTLEEGLGHRSHDVCQTSPGQRKHIFHIGSRKSYGSLPPAKGSETLPVALQKEAPQGSAPSKGASGAVRSWESRPFHPQGFYMRSSAFLRHRPLKQPPVIAPGAGTSRRAVLLPPPAPPQKPRVHQVLGSLRPEASRPVLDLARECNATLALTALSDVCKVKDRKVSSASSEGSDTPCLSKRRRVKIRTHRLLEGSICEGREALRLDLSKTTRERAAQSDRDQLPVRVIPTSIEEIIASLQSEAQLATDQTIKELIQSVLGQNYDIKMEQTLLEELPEDLSSIFQIEQEDISEWGVSDTGSMVSKPQEIPEVQPTEETRNLSEDEEPVEDSKAAKRVSLKVSSSEFLQIKGKEVKRMRKSKFGFQQQRPRKSLKYTKDQKLAKK
ncbi:PREDICTED: putative uncharacterized protein C14orf25-like [Chrysochloris asiatica]|uniref:Uncharacterized protein n=1 Tax=Chrysochloris asiatica TaxID=185453 RepID=A0A9B0T7P4_CHRAS|nr:PREDICTED: putative uncharacterized protein C14orf25-like [Chrysochloris asiatica]